MVERALGIPGCSLDCRRKVVEVCALVAKRAARLALLDEAMTLLGGLTIEAQQLRDSKELIKWVTDSRREARAGE